MVKNLPAMRETWVWSWVGKILWRRGWPPTPVFLPGESHGSRSLAGYSPWSCKESDMTERILLSDTDVRSIGRHQSQCLENYLWRCSIYTLSASGQSLVITIKCEWTTRLLEKNIKHETSPRPSMLKASVSRESPKCNNWEKEKEEEEEGEQEGEEKGEGGEERAEGAEGSSRLLVNKLEVITER